jgi:hypothetical protein
VKNLTTAIFSTATGSAFLTGIGGRLYKNRADQDAAWPYAVFFVVGDTPRPTFKDTIEEVLVQFSIFSQESSSTEIEDLFTNLKALYDNVELTIVGNTFLMMNRAGASLMTVPKDTEMGEDEYWQYNVDYIVTMQKT